MTTCTCERFPKPHERQRLCGIGFNEFLGEVQHRLINAGYNPPAWPEPSIRDQGDLDAALDSCVLWCAARLDAPQPESAAKMECPTCESPDPGRHPAVQFEGEVHLCRDPWHKPSAAEIEASWQFSAEQRRTGPLGMRVCEPACHSAAACLNPNNCKANMKWENERLATAAAPSSPSEKHSEGPTPRTDAFEKLYQSGNDWAEYRRAVNFARQLEQELADAFERATSMERAAVAYQEQFAASLQSATTAIPDENAIRNDECNKIIAALDARGSASTLIHPHEAQVTHRNPITIRDFLQRRIQHRLATLASGSAKEQP